MTCYRIPVMVLPLFFASCSTSDPSPTPDKQAPATAPVELTALALYQREGVGNILGSTSWMTWVTKDGTFWIQRVATTRDLKLRESDEEWRSRGGVWQSQITRWRASLPEQWWSAAERLAGEHRFFEQSENVRDPGPLAGVGKPTILAISRTGTLRKVSEWEGDRSPDFDPLYDHLKTLRKQIELANPEYEGIVNPEHIGDAEKDWQPPEFPSPKERPQK